MGNFVNPETPTWVVNVPKIETTDLVLGGLETAPLNASCKALVERSAYLKTAVEAIQQSVIGGTAAFGSSLNADLSRSMSITHNLGTTGYGVELAPTTNPSGTWGEWWIHTRGANTVELRTSGSYAGNVRWTIRRTTTEV
ncbi:MAG: hypothetical protein IV100_12655 [Myxococcales bacterium]|uniref:hypothetical protein n=1 Tax=Sediminibacterium sp. TaxID=1917865 RepID=UPI001D55FE5F|nr:hypothetical protein [Sediminibacterium sp.]MBT9485849.1 hypothetical protein [Sediminibacterium sp.]MBT9556877.1 hypothetical protein [Myxococcales bacterium]